MARSQKRTRRKNAPNATLPIASDAKTATEPVEPVAEITREPETSTCETETTCETESNIDMYGPGETEHSIAADAGEHEPPIVTILSRPEGNEIGPKEAHAEKETQEMTNSETLCDHDNCSMEESPTIEVAQIGGLLEDTVEKDNKESVKEEETETKTKGGRNGDNDATIVVEYSTLKRTSLVEPVKTVDDEGNSVGPQAEVEKETGDNPWVIPDSNLRDPKRRICIVTTAALPWRTGTAVNPLLRALYLTRGRQKHYISLVIPWCEDETDRQKTLGKDNSFANQEEQEAWIRNFCRTRARCSEEEKNLKIIFYPSKYHEGFGSIFPSVDICALIPEEEADCAVLEEPEHLTWLRVPKAYKETDEEREKNKKELEINESNMAVKRKMATAKEKAELGWRFKFRHVVGIVHTNYKAYVEHYGMGAKFITAPALCALNALVIRAYCHRVILLSGTLPSLTPYKEVICNVHGVRAEFLKRPATGLEAKTGEAHAPVYFIGKLIWAKGFDKILDLENMYRERHNKYFPIDIYGAGGDEKAIKRAFFGRIPQIQRNDSPKSSEGDNEEAAESPKPDSTAEVFTWESSLRSHLVDAVPFKENEKHDAFDEFEENVARRRSSIDKSAINVFEGKALSVRQLDVSDEERKSKTRHTVLGEIAEQIVPISVIGHTMAKGLDTAKATTGAAVAVVTNVVNAGLNVAFTNGTGAPRTSTDGKMDKAASGKGEKVRKQRLIFDPPQSAFEFRRNPIQARFLGTKDHVLLRDIPDHKIFLNMSITEVLCTTSAEALAMGKWVILPKHPSNTFFLQFPNCLAYDNLELCLEKLEWALAHDPTPLSEEIAQKLSWEGATERFFDSSAVTKDEFMEWEETGKIKSDDDAARFHVETGMKGQLIGKFFAREKPSNDKIDE